MKTREKHVVLNSLVSSIRYSYLQGLKLNINNIDNNYTKDLKDLFLKLNNQYFKNNEKTRNGYIKYLETILKEIKDDIENRKGIEK